MLFHRKPHPIRCGCGRRKLIEKKPFKLVAVALANKMARIAFCDPAEQDGLSGNSGVRSVPVEFAAEAHRKSRLRGKGKIEGDQEVMRRKAD